MFLQGAQLVAQTLDSHSGLLQLLSGRAHGLVVHRRRHLGVVQLHRGFKQTNSKRSHFEVTQIGIWTGCVDPAAQDERETRRRSLTLAWKVCSSSSLYRDTCSSCCLRRSCRARTYWINACGRALLLSHAHRHTPPSVTHSRRSSYLQSLGQFELVVLSGSRVHLDNSLLLSAARPPNLLKRHLKGKQPS